jgi:hypothetical protein
VSPAINFGNFHTSQPKKWLAAPLIIVYLQIAPRSASLDTSSKNKLAKTSYTGKSKWTIFGGDHPQDLLPEPTAKIRRKPV